MADTSQERLNFVPAQIIRAEGCTILKRGCIEIRFSGSHYADQLQLLLDSFQNGCTEAEMLSRIGEDQKPDIVEILELLKARKILIPMRKDSGDELADETPLEVFHWHFDPQGQTLPKVLRSRRLAILGLNSVSQSLLAALNLCGFENVTVVEYPVRLLPKKTGPNRTVSRPYSSITYETWVDKVEWKALDCVIATSDFGGRDLLREWNDLAVGNECRYFPVVLQDVIGFVGPFVIPGETACYECMVARENSHMDDFALRRTIERSAFEAQQPAYHPLMASIVGQIAAFELTKIYSDMIPVRHVGTLIEVNLLGTRMTMRKVLKIPRCIVCSSLQKQPSISIYKDRP
ncbi:MAG: TOMM precursor leader peptide-binding protein [Nitrospira sp.]